MNAVNTDYTEYNALPQINTNLNSKSLSIGDMISCTYSGNENGFAVLTMADGKTFKSPAENIVGNIGDKLEFSVADTQGNTVVMKQIIEDEQEAAAEADEAALSGEELLNWTKGSVIPITGAAFRSSKIRHEENAEQNSKMLAAVEKIKKDITLSVKGLSGSALALLAENGVSPGAITMTMLSQAVKTAVKGVAEAPSHEEVTKALEAFASADNSELYARSVNSVKALLSGDAAPTDSNVALLNSVQQKLTEISQMGTEDKLKFLKAEAPFTVSGMYASMHSAGASQAANVMGKDQWNELRDSVTKFMERENIPDTKENMKAARLLIEREIPVSKENIDFINGKLESKNIDEILEEAASNLQSGKSAFDAAVFKDGGISARQLYESYKDIIKELAAVTDSAIESLTGDDAPVTVAALINRQRQFNENGEQERQGSNENQNERFLSEKIKLEELRLRLTLSAAAQMAKAGISIDGMEVQHAINELKELEARSNYAALSVAGAEVTRENANTITRNREVFAALANTGDNVLRGILRHEIRFTAEEIHAANLRAREAEAASGYELNETRVNAKFGDGFGKVQGQIESLLLSLGIEPTAPNSKAAGSLIRTNTDVTKENIEAIKAINSKIEGVSQSLHPIIAAEMIKDGFNPLTSHIDEVIAYINKFNELNGEPPVESIENAIFDMDASGELSKSERDSLIAMYRMLTAINKNETVASAVISKSGKALTLENLMESGKYFEKSKGRKSVIEKTVDDNYGRLESAVSENSIREMLNRAYNEAVQELDSAGISAERAEQIAENNNLGQTALNIEAIKTVAENGIDEAELNAVLNMRSELDRLAESVKDKRALNYFKTLNKTDLEKTEIAKLLEGMNEFIANASLDEARRNMSESASFNVFKQDITSLRDVSPQQIAWLMALNLPLTVGNIKTAKEMVKDDSYLGKKLNELDEIARNITGSGVDDDGEILSLSSASSSESAADREKRVNERIEEIIDNAISSDTTKKAELLQHALAAKNAFFAAAKTRESLSHYQIPVKLNDKIGNLNVYLLNENFSADNMSAFVRLHFNGLGTVEGSINVKDGFADVRIGAENPQSLSLLEENAHIMNRFMEDLGYESYNVSFIKKHADKAVTATTQETPGNQGGRPYKEENGAANGMDVRL